MKTMYMQLSEKIDSQWQGDRRGYRKTSELREPLFLLPKGSYHGEESTPAGPKLVQHTADQSERWKLEKGIHPRRHRIVQGGEIHGETIVEGGGK